MNRLFGTATAIILIALVILDTLSPPGAPISAAIGAVAYGAKTLLGIGIVVFGLLALATTRLPVVFRIATIAYLAIVAVWFLIWLLGNTREDATTYLLNPNFSVWSWLMVLMVPLIARRNREGTITDAIARIPLTVGLVIVLVAAVGVRLGWKLNASNAGVALLFMLACRSIQTGANRVLHVGLALLVVSAMLISGYRIYAAAALVFAANLLIPRMSRRMLIAQLLMFTLAPLIFQYVITNYPDVFNGNNNSSLFVDTRSFLFKELLDDYSTADLWLGRGLDARYYSPYFFNLAKHYADNTGYMNIWRTSSEIGWLNAIMHVGAAGTVVFLLTLFIPALKKTRVGASPGTIAGMRRFVPIMVLLYSGELWNSISAAYFCWYVALGTLLAGALGPARQAIYVVTAEQEPPSASAWEA